MAGATGHLYPKMNFGCIPEGARFLGCVDDEALPVLYAGAAGFVYPSVYEGFGLPPLEAMASGCPVAVSDIPAHREVCGEAAIYFDPFNPEDLATKLERLLRLDRESRAALVEQGMQQAALYNWESAASDTWRVLKLAANS